MAIEAPPRIDVELRPDTFESLPPGYPSPRVHDAGLLWLRMSYEEYQRLPEYPKAEWFEGWAVIEVEAPKRPHADATNQLAYLLHDELPDLDIRQGWAFHIGATEFCPDIMGSDPNAPDDDYLMVPPVFAVEVLSPSTRRYDLVTKMAKYLEVGIGQYWTVDPRREEIIVRENAGDRWRELAVVDAEHPTATIVIGKYGSVTLDHATIFAARRPTAAPTPVPRG